MNIKPLPSFKFNHSPLNQIRASSIRKTKKVSNKPEKHVFSNSGFIDFENLLKSPTPEGDDTWQEDLIIETKSVKIGAAYRKKKGQSKSPYWLELKEFD